MKICLPYSADEARENDLSSFLFMFPGRLDYLHGSKASFEKLREPTSHLDVSVYVAFLPQRFNSVEKGGKRFQHSFNKIERTLKQMLKPFARAFMAPKMSSASASNQMPYAWMRGPWN